MIGILLKKTLKLIWTITRMCIEKNSLNPQKMNADPQPLPMLIPINVEVS